MDSQRELTNAITHTAPNGSSILQCEYCHGAGQQNTLLIVTRVREGHLKVDCVSLEIKSYHM